MGERLRNVSYRITIWALRSGLSKHKDHIHFERGLLLVHKGARHESCFCQKSSSLKLVGDLGVASGKWIGYVRRSVGVSPSGKAPVFGIGIPRFESWHPSHFLYLTRLKSVCTKVCAKPYL
jgi:hypothetical protein